MKHLTWKICNSSNWYFTAMSLVFVWFLFPTELKAQDESDLSKSLPRYLGVYTMNIHGKTPQGLEEFKSFEITELPNQDIDNPEVDKNGITFIDGELETTDGIIYKFKKAFLKIRTSSEYEYFEFKTSKVKGISYSFKGKFLEHTVQEVEKGSYTKIRGNLSKYKNGKKVASADIPFSEFAIL